MEENLQIESMVYIFKIESLVENLQIESLVENLQIEPLVELSQIESQIVNLQIESLQRKPTNGATCKKSTLGDHCLCTPSMKIQ